MQLWIWQFEGPIGSDQRRKKSRLKMSFKVAEAEVRVSKGLINLQENCGKMLDGNRRKHEYNQNRQGKSIEFTRSLSQGNLWRLLPKNYYSLESMLVLICLTALLLILPLILPPLPPPPFMLLLLPIGILVVLMFLAFTPSNAKDITYAYG